LSLVTMPTSSTIQRSYSRGKFALSTPPFRTFSPIRRSPSKCPVPVTCLEMGSVAEETKTKITDQKEPSSKTQISRKFEIFPKNFSVVFFLVASPSPFSAPRPPPPRLSSRSPGSSSSRPKTRSSGKAPPRHSRSRCPREAEGLSEDGSAGVQGFPRPRSAAAASTGRAATPSDPRPSLFCEARLFSARIESNTPSDSLFVAPSARVPGVSPSELISRPRGFPRVASPLPRTPRPGTLIEISDHCLFVHFCQTDQRFGRQTHGARAPTATSTRQTHPTQKESVSPALCRGK
jgi:hypothetical protein